MPTKAEEIEIITEAIKKLGPNSYLGPWLAAVREEVEACIKCDLFPDISIDEARRRVAEANLTAASINQVARDYKEQMKKEADKIHADAHRMLSEVRNRIERAKLSLEGVHSY